MCKTEWIRCSVCSNKTRDEIIEDAVLKNYPLYCSDGSNSSYYVIYSLIQVGETNRKLWRRLRMSLKDGRKENSTKLQLQLSVDM